jgi:hypothetical protein
LKNRKYDTRLSILPYLTALANVETQFAMIRFALRELPNQSIDKFFQAQLNQRLRAAAALSKLKEKAPPEEKENWARTQQMARELIIKKHDKDNKPSDNRFKLEFSQDRLNQSELLLLVAHFESYMKQVHRTFLIAAPAKVFSKSDTQVRLRDVFDDQTPVPFEKFLNELIIKEVKSVDTQSITWQAKYFLAHYGISFGSQVDIERLKEISDMRNKISHNIYHAPPQSIEEVVEQTIVSDHILEQARRLFRAVPKKCVEAGVKAYPDYFR